MRQLVIVTVVALGVGTTLAYAQEANLNGTESRFQLLVLAAFSGEAFVMTQEQMDRLAWAEERLRLGERLSGSTNERVTLAGQPTTTSGGGNRFGGPLLWAMVIIAATSVAFILLGISLSPEERFDPGDTQAIAAGESSAASLAPSVSVFGFGW